MNTNKMHNTNENRQSNKSIALSITCTLILVTMLLSNNDSASWLLRITLVVWLVHATISQIFQSTDYKNKKSDWLQDAKFNLEMLALEFKPLDRGFSTPFQTDVNTSSELPGPDLSRLWESNLFRKIATGVAKSEIIVGTSLMYITGVRDNSLLGKPTTSQFYREIWTEDVLLRKSSWKRVSFGFKCFSESCVFAFHDGYVSREIRILLERQ